MTLKRLIERLKSADQNKVVERGFVNPHSHRGDYSQLAFELSDKPMTVKEIIKAVKPCLGQTFVGYKGGDFKMDEWTDVYIANYGDCGDEISELLLDYMIGKEPS